MLLRGETHRVFAATAPTRPEARHGALILSTGIINLRKLLKISSMEICNIRQSGTWKSCWAAQMVRWGEPKMNREPSDDEVRRLENDYQKQRQRQKRSGAGTVNCPH